MVSAREGSSVSSRKDICSASAAIKEKLYICMDRFSFRGAYLCNASVRRYMFAHVISG